MAAPVSLPAGPELFLPPEHMAILRELMRVRSPAQGLFIRELPWLISQKERNLLKFWGMAVADTSAGLFDWKRKFRYLPLN